MMPLTTFHPLLYKQLIDIATGTNYLPDVVGQIRMFQGNDLKTPRTTTEVRIGLLLNRHQTFFLKKCTLNPTVYLKFCVRPTYIYSHNSCRSKMVRLTIMDNVSAQFRDLHSMTVMKYKVVIITSINPRVFT
ncbi:unnamed protein product [Brassica napus]|uniref:(rape) hypothetical protein n=1 Tax=Brassica napus TaxID=3708 RepID=A0A816L7Y8_BRANA|nr:unnamed protein product [Brassica napus]